MSHILDLFLNDNNLDITKTQAVPLLSNQDIEIMHTDLRQQAKYKNADPFSSILETQ